MVEVPGLQILFRKCPENRICLIFLSTPVIIIVGSEVDRYIETLLLSLWS